MTDRRTVLTGLASLPLVGLAAGARAQPGSTDARLVAIAAELEDIERRCEALPPGTVKDTSALDAMAAGFEPLEDELAELGANSMAGVLAKARALQVRTVRASCREDVLMSIADDLVRLFPAQTAKAPQPSTWADVVLRSAGPS